MLTSVSREIPLHRPCYRTVKIWCTFIHHIKGISIFLIAQTQIPTAAAIAVTTSGIAETLYRCLI